MARPSTADDSKTDPSESSSSAGTSHLNAIAHPQQFLPAYRVRLFVVVILLLGAVASSSFMTIGIVSSMNESEEQFSHEGEELAHAVQLAMDEYDLFGLWVHQSCFKSGTRKTEINIKSNVEEYLGMCSRQEFRNLYLHLISRSDDFKFQAVQFLPLIHGHERHELERQSRAYYQYYYPYFDYKGITYPQYPPDFGLVEILPRTRAPFYMPVHYIEPLEANEAAVDLDVYAEEQRAAAINKVLDSFAPSVTRGIRLVQETDPNALGIILRHPGIPTPMFNISRPTFLAQVVIRVHDMLERATSGIVHSQSVYLYDSTNDKNDPDFLGAIEMGTVEGETIRTKLPKVHLEDIPRPRKSHMYSEEIEIADRMWICAVVSREESPHIVYIILGGAIIFCASLLLAIWFQTRMSRLAKINELRAQAESEKSKNAQLEVRKERQINEYLSHEVRHSCVPSKGMALHTICSLFSLLVLTGAKSTLKRDFSAEFCIFYCKRQESVPNF